MCMRQTIKYFLCIGCLAFGVQSAWAFSLLGPAAAYTGVPATFGDAWEVTLIGYNPLPNTDQAYGIVDPNAVGPKNQGEGYRRNTPVMYYAFDPSFGDYFGSNGEFAVQQAFDLLNGVFNGQTNTPLFLTSPNFGVIGDNPNGPAITLTPANSIDSYSANLAELALSTETYNYQAQTLGLQDVKSFTLGDLMEVMGLADPVRYAWCLHDRVVVTPPPCPGDVTYLVVQRNFDVAPSPLDQVQYSAYVNAELYTYYIYENCGAPGISPPDAAALPIPMDPTVYNPPVASGGAGLDFLGVGTFYTGLTRDDVAGLRWLYSTNNYDTPSAGYHESPAAGSALFNYGQPQLLFTSNYTALATTALTNSPANLQALYPALTFSLLTNYFSNVVSSSTIFVTNYPYGGIPGQGYAGTQTVYSTNIVEFYIYSFGNVVTNKIYPKTTFALQTIMVGPPIGQPVNSPFVTNVTYQTFQSNVLSGDYFVISNGACPPDIQQTLQTNVTVVTNLLSGVTNTDGSSIVQNLIYYSTNYVFVVQPCTLTTNAIADYQGIGRIQFIRVRDDNYDYTSGNFITPITNQYTMVVLTNGVYQTRTFQRVVTAPDFIIQAADLDNNNGLGRGEVFNMSNIQPNLAGPGTIDPPTAFVFNKVGTALNNTSPAFLNQASATPSFLWGSFDGTTNPPVVYPNGTSLVNLQNEAITGIHITPPVLPDGTNGVAYSVAMTAGGNQPPYTWSLAPLSAGLPPGLTLSSAGVISGTPTQSGTFDNIEIQVSDSETPPRTVQMTYSLTIH